MARSSVGSRELKTRLGRYLQRVRLGETIVVTDRSEPVAELRPVGGDVDPRQATLRRLAAEGLVTLPTRRTLSRGHPVRARRGASASAAIRADRDSRG